MNAPQHEELREERRQSLAFVRLRKWLSAAIIFLICVCILTLVLDMAGMPVPIVSDFGHWLFSLAGLR
jgi:hypothetical protein